ncbi:hypothetical protein EOD42_17170 [Rhodovarius crocodyli]|uniref:Uncharacterized protein n=1 Tax=Rhodovarius crocodyli TaxID=1979269 RepID=A0A437MCD9_9PROT|nr:hypothetical protein [Rhodovarius crocodyli]RVT95314.1 hypothetical protein EOD42_17170 [Rhodovarius crocodyli]
MESISVGAVGAAVIAGIFSLVGLIITKEQKVSDFRQAWIDELRKCFIFYISNINSISDIIRSSPGKLDIEKLNSKYVSLNEANVGIKLRINPTEELSKKLLDIMNKFEHLASKNALLTPENIRKLELEFFKCSQEILKFEWKRVKKGELAFIMTKYIAGISVIIAVFLLVWSALSNKAMDSTQNSPNPILPIYLISNP